MGQNWGYRPKSLLKQLILAVVSLIIFVACSYFPQSQMTDESGNKLERSQVLNIWWEQGLNHDEDEAIRTIINNWQQATGNKVNLSFFSNSELTAKAERAIEAGNNPDIIMNPKAERILYPRLAWQGKLADVSEVIQPIKNIYDPDILQAISYYNQQENKRSYYGVPIYQSTVLVYYWRSLLDSVALTPQDIPQEWDKFWQFWQQAGDKLEKRSSKKLFALGLTLSGNESTDDTHNLFEQILEAYDLNLLDAAGNLKFTPAIRQKLIDCLAWYVRLYRQGDIPPDAVEWSNLDNNRALLNQLVLMTPNNTLSIPATIRQDLNTYSARLGVVELPNKPSGKPMRYLIFVRQAVILNNSPHQAIAKEFLSYFIQPQVSAKYLQAAGSRFQPVQTPLWKDPYWRDTQDPYLATASKILTSNNTRLSYVVDNPAYSQVLAENIWGKALIKVTVGQISPDRAADEAIARIKEIFAEWKE